MSPNVKEAFGGANVACCGCAKVGCCDCANGFDCCDCANGFGAEMLLKAGPAAVAPRAPSRDFGVLNLPDYVSGVMARRIHDEGRATSSGFKATYFLFLS